MLNQFLKDTNMKQNYFFKYLLFLSSINYVSFLEMLLINPNTTK